MHLAWIFQSFWDLQGVLSTGAKSTKMCFWKHLWWEIVNRDTESWLIFDQYCLVWQCYLSFVSLVCCTRNVWHHWPWLLKSVWTGGWPDVSVRPNKTWACRFVASVASVFMTNVLNKISSCQMNCLCEWICSRTKSKFVWYLHVELLVISDMWLCPFALCSNNTEASSVPSTISVNFLYLNLQCASLYILKRKLNYEDGWTMLLGDL